MYYLRNLREPSLEKAVPRIFSILTRLERFSSLQTKSVFDFIAPSSEGWVFQDRDLAEESLTVLIDAVFEMIEEMARVDPSTNKGFTEWIARQVTRKLDNGDPDIVWPEDGVVVTQILEWHKSQKLNLPSEYHDIHRLSYHELLRLRHEQKLSRSQQDRQNKRVRKLKDAVEGSELLYEDETFKVLQLTLASAVIAFSDNTSWCTIDKSRANYYLNMGPFYLLYNSGEREALIHPATGQCKDQADAEIMFSGDNPVLSILHECGVLREYAQRGRFARFLAENLKSHSPLLEGMSLDDPLMATEYAIQVRSKEKYVPWPEAESLVKSHPIAASLYARKVMRQRWHEVEPVILEDLDEAYRYAEDFLRKRWPELEEAILESGSASTAFQYLTDFMDMKRWPEAEPLFVEDGFTAWVYARDTLKRRWPEAEPAIFSHPDTTHFYESEVLK